MAAFTVRMTGLMLHVGATDNEGELNFKHVAILDERTHHENPTLLIAPEDLVVPSTKPFVYKLTKYDVITFEDGLSGSNAAANARFSNGVPHLRTCVNGAGDLDWAIKEGKRHNAVQAYAFYRAGTLEVVENFKKKARYEFLGVEIIPPQCVPSIVEYVADDKGNNVTVRISRLKPDNTVQDVLTRGVRSGGTVLISNLTQHAGAKHFEHYKRLTDAPDVAMVYADDYCRDAATDFLQALSGGSQALLDEVKKLVGLSTSSTIATAAAASETAQDTHPDSERPQFTASPSNGKRDVVITAEPDPECSNSQWP